MSLRKPSLILTPSSVSQHRWDAANALIISNYGLLLVVLMMVWDYRPLASALLLLFTFASNAMALKGK